MMTYFKNNPLFSIILAIFLVAFLCYANTLYAPFVFDDITFFEQNSLFRSFSWISLSKFWTNFNFRTTSLLSFTLNYKLHGLWLPGYHLVTTVLHAINGVLVFFFVKKLFTLSKPKNPQHEFWFAAVAAAIFICHPIQSQAVVYVIQRMAVLATTFYLLAVLIYLRFRTAQASIVAKVVYILAFLFCYYLSLFSKQTGATIIASIAAIELFFFIKPAIRTKIVWTVCVSAIIALIVAIILFATNSVQWLQDFLNYFITQAKVSVLYFKLILFPVGQSFDHYVPLSKSVGLLEIMGLLWWSALLLSVAVFHRKFPLMTIGIAWFFITSSVESSIIPILDTMVEHRLYLPMIGLSITFASLLYELYSSNLFINRNVTFLLPLFIALLVLTTISRNMVWRNAGSLWKDAGDKNPANVRAYSNAGFAFINLKQYDKAELCLKKAIMQSPDISEPMVNLAYLHYQKGDTVQMRECLDHVALHYGFNYYGLCVRALYEAKSNKFNEAVNDLTICINESPHYYFAYKFLADIYLDKNDYTNALHWYTLALREHQGDMQLLTSINQCKQQKNAQ